MIIYVDILLALNWFTDFLLLCATARILSRVQSRLRLLAGSAVGAVSSLVLLLPPLPFALSLAVRVLTAAATVATAFPPDGIRRYLQTAFTFFAVSALFAGICQLLVTFIAPAGLYVQSGVVYYDIEPLWLVGFTCIAYGALCLFDRLTKKRAVLSCVFRVTLRCEDREVTLRAFLDSGHSLCEPFSGAPVILLSAAAMQTLFPVTVPDRVRRPPRLIPFSSLGGSGMLEAYRAPHATLYADDRPYPLDDVWVAAAPVPSRPDYDALIGPALVDRLPRPARKE